MRLVAYALIAAVAALGAAAVALLAADKAHAQMSMGLGIGIDNRGGKGGGVGVPAPAVSMSFANGTYSNGASVSCVSAATCLTTSRASTGTAVDTSGNWTTFPANQSRVTNLGLTVEESRANSVPNSTMQGTVAGSPGTLPTGWSPTVQGGLTQTVVGTGTESGIAYVDLRFNGTTSGAGVVQILFEGGSVIAATNGQSWTQSEFIKVASGSTTNIVQFQNLIIMNNAGGTFLAGLSQTYPPGSLLPVLGNSRLINAQTLNNASTAFVQSGMNFNFNSGVAIDITLRIGWPQLELGSFATTPIPTTGAAVTRAADVVTLTTVPTIGAAYTLQTNGTPQNPTPAAANQWSLSLDSGTAANAVLIGRTTAGNAEGFINPGNFTFTGPSWATNGFGKLAAAIGPGANQIASFNGTAFTPTTFALPSGLNTLHIGQLTGGYWNGTLASVALWLTALNQGQLQAITR